MILGLFVNILWSESGSFALPGTAVKIPGYMVPLAFLYAGLGTILGWLAGRPLVRATNALLTAEATFRFGLSRVRENPEAIALVHGESVERAGSSARFGQIVRQWNLQSLAYMGLSSFGTGYGGLLPVFPILIAAPQYISVVMTLGALMQYRQATAVLDDAWIRAGSPTPSGENWDAAQRIDHVFVSPQVEDTGALYVLAPLSDHPALVVQVK